MINSLLALSGLLAVLALLAILWNVFLMRVVFARARELPDIPEDRALMDSHVNHWTQLTGHHGAAPASFALVFGALALAPLGWLGASIVVIVTALVFDATHCAAAMIVVRDGDYPGIASVVNAVLGRRCALPFALLGIFAAALLTTISVYVVSDLMRVYPEMISHGIIFVLVVVVAGILLAGLPPVAGHILAVGLAVVTLAIALGSEPWQFVPRHSFMLEANPKILTLIVSVPVVFFALIAAALPAQFVMRPMGQVGAVIVLIVLTVLVLGLGVYPGTLHEPLAVNWPAIDYRFFFGVTGGGALLGMAGLLAANLSARQVNAVDGVMPVSVCGSVFKAVCALVVLTVAMASLGNGVAGFRIPAVLTNISEFHTHSLAVFGHLSTLLSMPFLEGRWIGPYMLMLLCLMALPACVRLQSSLLQEAGEITGIKWLRLRRVALSLAAVLTFALCYTFTLASIGRSLMRHGFTTWRSLLNVAAEHMPGYGIMWSWPLFAAAALLVCATALMALTVSQRDARQPCILLALLAWTVLIVALCAAGYEFMYQPLEGSQRIRIGAAILAILGAWFALEFIAALVARRSHAEQTDSVDSLPEPSEEHP